MFGIFAKKPVEKIVVRDEVAQKICELLFPSPVEKNEAGQLFLVDYSIDSNLLSAIIDLEDDNNDEIVRQTLRDILKRLYEARDMLEANYKIDSEANYVIVDTLNKA